MSGSVICVRRGVAGLLCSTAGRDGGDRADQSGVGMLEFLIALVVFSTGVMGLLSVQLLGMQIIQEANQRSVATALARDILERIQANPINAAAYVADNIGDAGRPIPLPAANCDHADCSATELAVFDLWQWQALLLGSSVKYRGLDIGGLRAPLACIRHRQGVVAVVVSWPKGATGDQSVSFDCRKVGSGPGLQSFGGVPAGRHRLQLLTYVAGG